MYLLLTAVTTRMMANPRLYDASKSANLFSGQACENNHFSLPLQPTLAESMIPQALLLHPLQHTAGESMIVQTCSLRNQQNGSISTTKARQKLSMSEIPIV